MFFNDRPDHFFRYARIDVVDKPDETGTGMTEKVFYNPDEIDYTVTPKSQEIFETIIAAHVVRIMQKSEHILSNQSKYTFRAGACDDDEL